MPVAAALYHSAGGAGMDVAIAERVANYVAGVVPAAAVEVGETGGSIFRTSLPRTSTDKIDYQSLLGEVRRAHV